jgi:argininosuccinate lyase
MLVKKSTQRDRVTTKYWLMCTYLPKDEIKALKEQVKALFDLMMESAEKHQNVLLPDIRIYNRNAIVFGCGFQPMQRV